MHHKIKIFSLKRMALPILAIAELAISLPVLAAPGDLLQTVNIPPDAQCRAGNGYPNGYGTSVAVVPGSVVGLNQIPILLVTSCYSANTSSLYFLNPNTNPATLVGTLNTNTTPPLGWGALAYRADKQDLIGCGNSADGTHGIYRISLDGTATFLFNGRQGGALCNGLAWDAADATIFQSRRSQAGTIAHFRENGVAALANTFRFPANCNTGGLAVGGSIGGGLYAACDAGISYYQLNKRNGVIDNTFTNNTIARENQQSEDLECDNVSFASTNRDVIWLKGAFSNQLLAFEIPYRTCGLGGRAPNVPTSCPDGNTTDTDGDAILDCWENNGIDFNADGNVDWWPENADPNRKDVYLEIDWMAQHQPHPRAVEMVINSFANAAVNNPVTPDNPDGARGINLHVETNEQAVQHNNELTFSGTTVSTPAGVPDFGEVKTANFGTAADRESNNYLNILNAKRMLFHYALFGHGLLGNNSVGSGEIWGNDLVVTHGGWTNVNGHDVGTTDQQAATLMHELGHNLGLDHGGGDDVNCKPNYLSVMSYSHQNNGSFNINVRPLDYSRVTLPTLFENNLNEPAGLGGNMGDQTAYGPPPLWQAFDNEPIDWNKDGDSFDVGVSANINNLGGICENNLNGERLVGYDDWENLRYNIRNVGSFADNAHLNVPAKELSFDDAVKASSDTDGDGLVDIRDNCPFNANGYQADRDGNGVGDVCQKNPRDALNNLVKTVRYANLPKKLRHALLDNLTVACDSQQKGQAIATLNQVQHFIQLVKANTAYKNSHGHKGYGYQHADKPISYGQSKKLMTAARQIAINIEEDPSAHSKPYHRRHY
jgi:Thrombospondin type 3 repeat